MEVWRARMREHAQAAYVHLFVNEGEAAAPRAAHPRAARRARLRAGADRPRARALRRLRRADDGPAAARRPRRRGGAPRASGSSRSTTRRCCSSPYAAALPYQLMLVPRRPRMRFEDDGPTGAALLHDALARLARRFAREPAAEPVGPHRAARRRALLLADRHPAAAARARGPRAGQRRGPQHASRPEQAAAELRESVRARRPARRAGRASRSRARRSRRSGPACWCCSASATTTRRGAPTASRRRSACAADLRRRRRAG